MNRFFSLYMVFCLIATVHPVQGQESDKPIWLAVGPSELVAELKPLVALRRRQGMETVVSSESAEKAIAACPRKPAYILLVGDDQQGSEKESWYLPAPRRDLYRWRRVQGKQFAADAILGDYDKDLIPDVPVGRIPARNPQEVSRVALKTVKYELQPPSLKDLQMPIWAGSPGYGATIDAMATTMLLNSIRGKAPGWLQPWVISADPNHPLCGWPSKQGELFGKRVKNGGVCHILMGHANEYGFFSMRHRGQPITYTIKDAAPVFADGTVTAPLVVFSCSAGNFTVKRRCFAESMLLLSGGPVVTIAATTESHPLTNFFSGEALLGQLSSGTKRIGPAWLKAQRQAHKARNFLIEGVLRDAEGKLDERINVTKLRRDQLLMYAILGDPATTLRLPRHLKATVSKTNGVWTWKAERPDAKCELSVDFKPQSQTAARFPRATLKNEAAAQKLFADANQVFEFRPLRHDDWQGKLEQPGLLRLVARSKKSLHVTTLKIE